MGYVYDLAAAYASGQGEDIKDVIERRLREFNMEHGVSYTETYDGDIALLGMSPAMDDVLRSTLDVLEDDDRDRWYALKDEINEAINEKIQEFGVSEDGEWMGEWSAEQVVRGILGRYGVQCPAVTIAAMTDVALAEAHLGYGPGGHEEIDAEFWRRFPDLHARYADADMLQHTYQEQWLNEHPDWNPASGDLVPLHPDYRGHLDAYKDEVRSVIGSAGDAGPEASRA